MTELSSVPLRTFVQGLAETIALTGESADNLVVVNPRQGAITIVSRQLFDRRHGLDDAVYERLFGDEPRVAHLQDALDAALDYIADIGNVLDNLRDVVDTTDALALIRAIADGAKTE